MYTLIAENSKGEQMELTNNPAYVVTQIDGLSPAEALVNTLPRAGLDGSDFNSAKVGERSIILTIAINSPACQNRNELYRFFQPAQKTRLYYFNDMNSVYIDGWCQTSPVDIFGQKQTVVITLLCPDPHWHGVVPIQAVDDGVSALFEFPFAIDEDQPVEISEVYPLATHAAVFWNDGTIDSGVEIKLTASGAVDDPQIYHVQSDKFFKLNTSLQNGDIVTISTYDRNKSVIRLRSGVKRTLVASIDRASTWLKSNPGRNDFIFSAYNGIINLSCMISTISNRQGV